MTFNKFMKKWDTGKTSNISCYIINDNKKQEVMLDRPLSEAGLGDFMEEFIKHQNISRWRRSFDWKSVSESMKNKLDMIKLSWNN